MDLLWLRDFEALAAQRNFSRAAEQRHVSQPAFSRRIRALEDDIGVGLINRQTLPLSLTPAGEVFLDQARRMLDIYSETIERCHAVDAADAEIIRFATSQSLYLTHYKTLLAPLIDGRGIDGRGIDGRGIDVDLNSTSWAADQFVTALLQGYCDVILTYWHPEMDFLAPLEVAECEFLTLEKDRLLPVAQARTNDNTPLRLPPINPKKSVPVLSYGSASALNPVVAGILKRHVPPQDVLSVNQHGLAVGIKAMILENFGMGWLPQSLCADELAAGTLVIAGGETLHQDLEVRLYRRAENTKANVEKLWAELQPPQPAVSPPPPGPRLVVASASTTASGPSSTPRTPRPVCTRDRGDAG